MILLGKETIANIRDLFPVVAVIAFFQIFVISVPMPDIEQRAVGMLCALVGLTLFVRGLSVSIFPAGEAMADWLARRGSLPLLMVFAFGLGFGSTVAEPALAAVCDQAAAVLLESGLVSADDSDVSFSNLLRYGVSFAVGCAIALGVLRILKGWPIAGIIIPGYVAAAGLAFINQSNPLSAIAFDVGAAATSAINIPLMLALGIGLASMIRGRSVLVDGFGLVALASLTPMLFVLLVATVMEPG